MLECIHGLHAVPWHGVAEERTLLSAMTRWPAAFSAASTNKLITPSASHDNASGSSGIQNARRKMLWTTTPLPRSQPYLSAAAHKCECQVKDLCRAITYAMV